MWIQNPSPNEPDGYDRDHERQEDDRSRRRLSYEPFGLERDGQEKGQNHGDGDGRKPEDERVAQRVNELTIVQYRSAVILNSDELRQAAASPFENAQRGTATAGS